VNATLQWYGTATWRLEVDGFVCWLDAYIDRASTAAPAPVPARQVNRADLVLIGHSHFDHIADAPVLMANTAATLVGSALSCEIVEESGIRASRLVRCSGGEGLAFGPLRVRTYPSLHGFNGIREWPDPQGRDRAGRIAALRERDAAGCEAALAHLRDVPPKQMQDGGPLACTIEWDGFRLFWHDTPGMVTASWQEAAKTSHDLALFSAAAAFSTPNVDGEPFEPGQYPFVTKMAEIVRPKQVILNHHDDWCPPITYHLDEEGFRAGVEGAGASLRVVGLGETVSL